MKPDNFVQKITDKITALGLNGPAILLLEANKPLAFLGSQLLLVAQPALDIFIPQTTTQQTINLLSNAEQVEQLIISLEARAGKNHPASAQPSTEEAHR